MAGVEHRDAAGEVDVTLAFDVPELGVLGPVGENSGHMADAAGDRGLATSEPHCARGPALIVGHEECVLTQSSFDEAGRPPRTRGAEGARRAERFEVPYHAPLAGRKLDHRRALKAPCPCQTIFTITCRATVQSSRAYIDRSSP